MKIRSMAEFKAWISHRLPEPAGNKIVSKMAWLVTKRYKPPKYGSDWSDYLDRINVVRLYRSVRAIKLKESLSKYVESYYVDVQPTVRSDIRRNAEKKLRTETDARKRRILTAVSTKFRYNIYVEGVVVAKGDSIIEVLRNAIIHFKGKCDESI